MQTTTMNYRTAIVSTLAEIDEPAWSALLALQAEANPFLSYAFLHAMHESGCASADSGWQPQFLALWQGDTLAAALPLYVKLHSYGEYVFDWAWADAYQQHGLEYYPKLLSAIPFTPVSGSRLLLRLQKGQQGRARLAIAGQQAAAADGRKWNGRQQFRIVFQAVLLVGVGPGPVEHIFAVGMQFDIQRQGGGQGIALPQHQELRLPA